MTAVDTTGYNIAWFSPKQMFTDVSQVCWDINETLMSRRKWTQVVFVSAADAGSISERFASDSGRSPADRAVSISVTRIRTSETRTAPDSTRSYLDAGFQTSTGPPTGSKDTSWVEQFVGPGAPDREQTTDKAARYQHCLTNGPGNTVILTKATPTTGTVTPHHCAGQIPPGSVRVVFQDDEYDGMKDDRYDPNVVTWHWDNIHVEAGAAGCTWRLRHTKRAGGARHLGLQDAALAARRLLRRPRAEPDDEWRGRCQRRSASGSRSPDSLAVCRSLGPFAEVSRIPASSGRSSAGA